MERTADELTKEAQPANEGGDDDDEIVALETVGAMQATGEFDNMIVWSHESIATAAADPYVRSVEEWLQMSEKVLPSIAMAILLKIMANEWLDPRLRRSDHGQGEMSPVQSFDVIERVRLSKAKSSV